MEEFKKVKTKDEKWVLGGLSLSQCLFLGLGRGRRGKKYQKSNGLIMAIPLIKQKQEALMN
jgi:hypothetical protein